MERVFLSLYYPEPEFLNFLGSPNIDSKEPIPSGYVAWRIGRQPYSFSVPSPHRLLKNSSTAYRFRPQRMFRWRQIGHGLATCMSGVNVVVPASSSVLSFHQGSINSLATSIGLLVQNYFSKCQRERGGSIVVLFYCCNTLSHGPNKYKDTKPRGVPRILAGGCTFLADPLPADPQPWAQLSKDCCLIYNYV